jgi:hypothetical protein
VEKRDKKRIDGKNKTRKNNTRTTHMGRTDMFLLMRESAALASIAGFAWVVCSVAQYVS